jgi:hypothetical protein
MIRNCGTLPNSIESGGGAGPEAARDIHSSQPSQIRPQRKAPMSEPQPKPQLGLEDFIEAASRAALRAVDAHAALNPQPLPPGRTAVLKRSRIFIGIVAAPEE